MQMQARDFAEGDRTNAVLGRGLGLFSVGLGLAELATPRAVARLIGVDARGATLPTVRALGAREILTGLGLLARPQAGAGPWARVVGDLINLAFLGWQLKRTSFARHRTLSALAAVAGLAALDAYAGVRRRRALLGPVVRRAITINRTPDEVYTIWRDLERLPDFMTWVQEVRDLGGGLSRWTIKTPTGATIEYDTQLTDDVPGHRIAWRTVPGGRVAKRGQVTFLAAPGGRGTEVTLDVQVAAPLAKTFASAEAKGDLRRLKQVLETGEIVHSDASIHKGPHPARPAEV